MKVTLLFTSASCSLVLTIAAITNLNATFSTEALEDIFPETTSEEISASEANEDVNDTTPSNDTENASEEILQNTLEQIENDPTFQSYNRLFEVLEEAQNLTDADRATVDKLKVELSSALKGLAEIGGGQNLNLDSLGDLQTKTLDEILSSTTLIANYHEYYELATLVKTAQATIASNQTSTAHISQILQATTVAARQVNIPVKTTAKPASVASAQEAPAPSSDDVTTNSNTTTASTTAYAVRRPNSSHTEAEYSTDEPENGNVLANALAHTTTTCVAFGTLIIGKLSAKRQK